MKKRILSLLLAALMVFSLFPVTAFATGTTYAITNGTLKSAKETNHGYIAIDKATAAEGDKVEVTVVPNNGYKLKSLVYSPTPKTVADILPEEFPAAETDASGAPATAWKSAMLDQLCYISYDKTKLFFYTDAGIPDKSFGINTYEVVSADEDENYVYKNGTVTVTFFMKGENGTLNSVTFANTANTTWDGTYQESACVAAGTVITMYNGEQKKVEDLEIGDVICTFDHETGEVSSAPIAFIWESKNAGNAFTLTFEDDIEVTVIEEHGFYDQEKQKYVFINLQNAEEYIGDHFYNADTNSWLELKNCEALSGNVDAYAIITSGDLNHMSNGMLSMCDGSVKVLANIFEYDDQMKFDADRKKADIETYGLTSKEKILEFEGFLESDYDDYNLQYLNVAIGKGLTTWEWIEAFSDYCVENGLVDIYSGSETAEENEAPRMLLMSATAPKTLLGSTPEPTPQDGIEIKANENGTYTFIMPGYAVTVTAEFEEELKSVAPPTAKENLVYTGEEQTGVVEATGYTVADGKKTDAGEYTATATLAEGYKWSDGTTDTKSVSWSIAKADYDMSGVSFTDATKTYDGSAHNPVVSGTLPTGADKIQVTVSYSEGQTAVGEKTVTATFATTSTNYNVPEAKTAKQTITAAEITNISVAQTGTLTYNGQPQTATVSASATTVNSQTASFTYCDTADGTYIAAVPGFKTAGNHTVYYKVTAPNHGEKSGSFTVTIGRADGSGSVSMNGWTYGGTKSNPVPASTTNGTESMTYQYKVSTAEDSTYTDTKPTNAGTYTVKATFAATVDYNEVTATADFTIAPKEVSVTAGTYAVSKVYDGKTDAGTASGALAVEGILTADTGVTVQPGTIPAYDSADAKSDYSLALPVSINGDTNENYKLKNETVTVTGKITQKDVTGATVGTFGELTYTGSAQTPSATVTIDSLTATGTWSDVTSVADTTTFTANGNFTGTITGQTTGMKKAPVTAPTISSKAYTGETLTADVDCTGKPYTVTTNAGGTAVGSYDVILTLSNTTNYKWTDSEDAVKTLQFSITKADNSWTAEPAIADVTYGTAISPVGAAKFGVAAITYVGTGKTTYNSTNAPTDAGTYKATFSVAATNNCNELSADVDFTIAKRTVTLTTDAKSKIYGESDPELTSTLTGELVGTDTLKYTLSRTEGETVGAYTISAALGENPNYAVTVKNDGKLTISKATPTAANFTFTAPEHRAYDGQAKTATVVFDASTGLSGMGDVTVKYARKTGVDTWDAAASEEPKNAGTYKVSISVAEGTNYSAVSGLTADNWTFDIYAVSSDPTVNVPVSGDKDSVKVQATVSGSNATVKNVTSEQLETVGTGENVTIDLSSLSKSVSGVTIPKTTFENVAASEADGLEVKLPNGTTAVFDSTTVAAVAEQAAGSSIQLVIDKENKAEQALTAAQKETVKELNDALVLDAYFVSNGKRISDFKGGEAELTVSYPTTKPVRVWYVAADGTMELVPSTFDGKAAKFVVTHFSHYAIEVLDGSSYTSCPQDNTCVYAKFTDANTAAWYHDGVHYCVENGMMNGVSNTQFAPNGTITRGMIVTMLWRLDGQKYPNYYMTFKDVPASEWYTEAVRWAAAEKIVSGYDAEHFGPNDPVTREQLATILYNYAKYKGQGFSGSWMFLLDFVDRGNISSWADEAVHWCSMKSIVTGKDGKVFDPQGYATRAEAASMMQRFCEALDK